MPQAAYHFTKGFLWGCATAAHQVEGDNTNNDWWAWEQQPGRILNGDKSGLATDWWGGRWKEDFDRAEESHQNAQRLSIEWSRIQPAPDRWDEHALDVYREMVKGLHERGMTPMVTLWHFSLPAWVAEQGGWMNEATIGYFVKFVEKAVGALKEYVSLWMTLNEATNYAQHAFLFGKFPPGMQSLPAFMQVLINMTRAHALAYRAIHEVQPQASVGIGPHYRSFKPAWSASPIDRLLASTMHKVFNEAVPRTLLTGRFDGVYRKVRIPEAINTQDFFGLNYYTRELVGIGWKDYGRNVEGKAERRSILPGLLRYFPRGAELGDRGFNANVPDGMYEALKWACSFKVPVYITENGIEDRQDDIRRRYLVENLRQVWRGVNFAWPVRGYFHWTLVDNFEWERGWTQRYGLWELDPATQARRKRKSASCYASICKENGISSEIVAQYTPELLGKLFPGF